MVYLFPQILNNFYIFHFSGNARRTLNREVELLLPSFSKKFDEVCFCLAVLWFIKSKIAIICGYFRNMGVLRFLIVGFCICLFGLADGFWIFRIRSFNEAIIDLESHLVFKALAMLGKHVKSAIVGLLFCFSFFVGCHLVWALKHPHFPHNFSTQFLKATTLLFCLFYFILNS